MLLWPAPAKLNLFLHIIGRREDGYHLLQTAFQFVDYCDWLEFRPSADGRIEHLSPLPGVPVEHDLVYRAALLLQQRTACSQGVEVRIRKHLPMGGGLGGGSSDAATTLVALNHLWETGLSISQLAQLGLELGADVPVFIYGRAAWAEGVGEQLQPLELPEPWYLIVTPAVQVSTREVFIAPELTRDCKPMTISGLLAGEGENVCEPVVRGLYPVVADALDWLSQFSPARMTGTGSSIFAAFDGKSQALAALACMPSHWQGIVAKGCNYSLLLDCLEKTGC
ncbi:4-diphosphocytidyl-2-C-methyl-D-erythritol kinase [Nitrosococcus oceani ATCC 19707]|uniref:4-diphosphocytidyl-2-C-methyl-D-erythritol kinase n=2 Tax=Nitrosococcus oceani TaxID=1229 RepID=ISPE_NITOC|nr:4-(cytidine 5'-diphospho)-2-C-methyl-D-erythritol kinase [Nitrosococcus oceani]Q3JDR0.1 RecName: Full=4-diphosphocytidyl-2-C-methyl-D-erythritol kinase; Short=CMK; AltName: Full=4-(cytidine-5'-diphospho)-2-C-methyl-D-erythritol kinase [Nitrosococcus oceani ATCC 19707]KFI20506.1 kinase [Nitrosococcus oceani C-27]ABA57036.1 4-diphosphocytidyl-2-C-methyl-D-erythritol kinase [Nitrosococcus oceani ATCC 19707]EDZ65459.1 4-diphosphocytidyl-2C-methyl-D-erythritol kinase [Nitrosococcus oceani AFC27]